MGPFLKKPRLTALLITGLHGPCAPSRSQAWHFRGGSPRKFRSPRKRCSLAPIWAKLCTSLTGCCGEFEFEGLGARPVPGFEARVTGPCFDEGRLAPPWALGRPADDAPATNATALGANFEGASQLLQSLGPGSAELVGMSTNSKSGEFFYLSGDRRFIIKTISDGEAQVLHAMLPCYQHHLRTCARSFLTRFAGFFHLRIGGSFSRYFVVMASVFDPECPIHETYDLKGSLFQRSAGEGESVGKDADWLELGTSGAVAGLAPCPWGRSPTSWLRPHRARGCGRTSAPLAAAERRRTRMTR